MRITVIIPSRGRPAGLLSVLTALDALSTGSHEITYALIVDADDDDTLIHANQWQNSKMLPRNTHVIVGERSAGLFKRINEVCGAFSAEVYCQINDDVYPLTQHWDAMFQGLSEQLPAFAWQEKNDSANATYIAITERWRKAIGRMYPEYFPFWFVDTWLLEVHLLAFAKPIGVINQLQLGGKRGKTRNMRDLGFWFRMFVATRGERIEEAKTLAREFGFTLNMAERADKIAVLEENDARQFASVPEYEKLFQGEQAKDELYDAAKAAAEKWLDANERRIVMSVGRQIEVVH